MPRIVTNLWFDRQAEEAVDFYCSVFPSSKRGIVTHYPDGTDRAGEVLTVDFELDGAPFTALNGGPQFTFDEAISILIECEDQAELDRYWAALIADGGEEGPCGWCKDRFGLSWQVVPAGWSDIASEGDPEKHRRVYDELMKMHKIDIATLQAAADG